MNICTTPVSEIEGIGPATAELLSDLGIDYLNDFLRNTPPFLASQSDFSLEKFEEWRSSTLLLELEGMDKQLAEALVEDGVIDPEHLSILDLDELSQMVTNALADDRVDEIPGPAQLAALQVKAAKVTFGRQVQGRVQDENGVPIEGVEMKIAGHSTLSNSKGYWRVIGLNPISTIRVLAIKEGYVSHVVDDVIPESDMYSMEIMDIVMPAGVSEAIVLDEYLGDDLGTLDDYVIDEVNLGEEEIREGDLFKVSYHYVNGDIKFTSMYLSMSNEYLQVFCFRVSGEHFHSPPELYTYWKVQDGQIVPSDVSDGSLLITKAIFKERARRSAPDHKLSLLEAMGTPFSVSI